MIITSNAKRYAKALFELLHEKNFIEKGHQDFKAFLALVKESSELHNFLSLPLDQERQRILAGLLKAHFSELFFNFILVVLKNKRFYLIDQIFEDFEARIDSLINRVSAIAVTAVPLPADVLAGMTREIAKHLKADVRLENKIDPSILGGIILRVDDKIYNASLSEQFKKLKYHLIQNQK